MISISLPLALLLVPACLIAGWFIALKKQRQQLKIQEEKFNVKIYALEQELEQQKQNALQFSEEKDSLSRELDAALTAQSNSLKQKYDALYLKYIEVNNEKNRLKGQLNMGKL